MCKPSDSFTLQFRLHRMLTGVYITTVYVPAWYRIGRLAQDLKESIMPELESTDRHYYKLFWGDIELQEEEVFEHYVEAHGMPLSTPVDLKVYVGHSPRPE